MSFFYNLSGEALTALLCFSCFSAIFLLFWGFGRVGVVAYILLGAVVSNIQVLKTAVLQSTPEPMVLGTVVFTSLFWAMDLLTENYGAQVAKKILYLSFLMPLLVLVWMFLTIAYEPVLTSDNLRVQGALETLFLPAPALFIASLGAYLISQWLDIWIFSTLKSKLQGRFLSMRAILATLTAGFVDNALFSIFAWGIFGIQKISWHALFWTYILGAYSLRSLLSLGAAPLLHLVRLLRQKGWVEPVEWEKKAL